MDLTPSEKITKAKIRLQRTQPFWSYLVLHLKTTEADEVFRNEGFLAGVDARGRMTFNPDEIDKLQLAEIEGLLCHEVFHVAFEHIKRLSVLKDKEQHELWNIAIDIVTNYNLKLAGMSLPSCGLIPDTHRKSITLPDGLEITDLDKKPSEQIFYELIKHCKKNKLYKNVPRFDKHMPSDGKSKSGQGKKGQGKQVPGTGIAGESESDKWKKILAEAATFAKQRGKMPGNMERLLTDLLNPIVDWRNLLYKYITNSIPFDFTYRRPSKKSVATGVYMPSILKENLEVVVGVDTSGSVSSREYKEFMSEVVAIAKSFLNVKMTLITWDTRIQEPIVIANGNIKRIMEAKYGGGGTDINCLFEEIIENQPVTRLLVILTDGYFGRIDQEPGCDLIYVLTKNGDKRYIESGQVIKMEDR